MPSYRIVVDAEVDVTRLPLLDGAVARRRDSQTVIDIDVVDQSHLNGVLAVFQGRGTALVSVQAMQLDCGSGQEET